MLGDEFHRTTPVRSLHPTRDVLRRTSAAQVDAELGTLPKNVNVSWGMVVGVDADNETLDYDPRHDLIVTYRVGFCKLGLSTAHQHHPGKHPVAN
jgi:hypothetical protein